MLFSFQTYQGLHPKTFISLLQNDTIQHLRKYSYNHSIAIDSFTKVCDMIFILQNYLVSVVLLTRMKDDV